MMRASSCLVGLAACVALTACGSREPKLTPPAAAAAVERYYDACNESDALGQCVAVDPVVVPWGGSPYLDPAFRWLRIEVLPGQTRTSSMFTPPPLRLIVPTAEGAKRLYDPISHAPTSNWQGGLWSYAPATATILKTEFNANEGYYTVDSTIAFAPIPWFAAFINGCLLCASGGGDVDPRRIEARLARLNGRGSRLYVWRSGGSWVTSPQPPASPIGSFFAVIGIIILTPVFLVILVLARRHLSDAGKAGPGPSVRYASETPDE